MKIKASEFLDYLNDLKFGIVENITEVDRSDSVTFSTSKVCSYSTQGFVLSDLAVGVRGTVRYSELCTVVTKYHKINPNAELDITSSGMDSLLIKCGRSKTRLPLSPHVLLYSQPIPRIDETAWKPLPANFMEAILSCEFVFPRSVSSEKVANCLNMTRECIDSLSAQMAVRCFWDFDIPFRFLVKAGRISRLKTETLDAFQLSGQWLCLRASRSIFCVPVYKDSYTDISQFLGRGDLTVEFPPDAADDLPVFSDFVKASGGYLTVEFCGTFCRLTVISAIGRQMTEIPMKCPDNYRFLTTPDMFKRMVSFGKCSLGYDIVYYENDKMSCAVSILREGVPYV